MKVSVSFLKSKLSALETIRQINFTDANYIHVDIMDGIFVQNKNDDLDSLLAILKKANKPLDIHLMMKEYQDIMTKLGGLKPAYLTVPVETKPSLEFIQKLRNHGIKVGLAINPETDVDWLVPYLEHIDLVLVMSVHPGMGGQTFLPESIDTLEYLSELNMDIKNDFLISIDGGINNDTLKEVKPYVDMVVSGSYICMSDNYQSKINTLRQ